VCRRPKALIVSDRLGTQEAVHAQGLRRSSVLRMICECLMRLRGFEGVSVAHQLRLLRARLAEALLLFGARRGLRRTTLWRPRIGGRIGARGSS
jgi:hypothetical protein